MTEMITRDLVRLDATLGSDKLEVIHGLAAVVADAGRTADQDQLVEDALAREATSRHRAARRHRDPALPHRRGRRSDARVRAALPAVDFGAKDGPADLAFLIAAPAGGDATHLKLLTKLARALVKADFTDALRGADDPDEVVGWSTTSSARPSPPPRPPRPPPPPRPRRRRNRRHRAATAPTTTPATADVVAAWSPSPPARPASPTPTWPPRPSRPRPSGPASTSHVETQGSAGSTPLDPP